MIKLHPQFQQLINLSLLLIIGKYAADIYLFWYQIFGILFFTFFIEHTLYYLRHKTLEYISFSSLSTSIGVMLMMATVHYWVYFVLIALALIQKQFLHYNHRHFFNPSNFALIIGLLFFYQEAHVVLGQLGDELWLMAIVALLAFSILYRVKRWVVSVSFMVAYLVFQHFIIVQSDPVIIMLDIVDRFYSVSFIVFIFFMLTDPQTTPKGYFAQSVFAIVIAFVATLLDYYFGFRVQHLFMVLFVATPLVILFESYAKAEAKKSWTFVSLSIIVLVLSVIIYIQSQPPYYLEMGV